MRARAFVRLLSSGSSAFAPLLLVVALPLAGVVSMGALAASARDAEAQSPKRGATARDAGPADRYDPDNVAGISQAVETFVKGNERYVAKDFPGAIDLYRKGLSLAPRSALGHYLLGEGHVAVGNLSEAEAAFKRAEELTDARHPALRSHVLFVLADVYERQKKWAEAKAAWQAYNDHAAKFSDAGAFPSSGSARAKVVDEMMKLEAQYVEVRARIAAEKEAALDAGARAAAPGTTAPKPAAPRK